MYMNSTISASLTFIFIISYFSAQENLPPLPAETKREKDVTHVMAQFS